MLNVLNFTVTPSPCQKVLTLRLKTVLNSKISEALPRKDSRKQNLIQLKPNPLSHLA